MKKKMSKRKKIIIGCVAAVAVVVVIVAAIVEHRLTSPSNVSSDLQLKSLNKAVLGARSYGRGEISVNESGIFYFDAEKLAYYDYETEDRYILCSTPQCKHNSKECNAYMGEMEIYGGYALYDGKIYVIYKEQGADYLALAEMDSVGQNKKIIVKIPVADGNLEEWQINLIEEVYYYQGYAYLALNWTKNVNYPYKNTSDGEVTWGGLYTLEGKQLLAISLEDGIVTELTEILCWDTDLISVNFAQFTEGNAVFYTERYDEKAKTIAEYYTENPEGGPNAYVEYCNEKYGENWEKRGTESQVYQMFVPETKEVKTMISHPVIERDGWKQVTYIMGVYKGKWLMYDSNLESEYYWFDPKTGTREEFMHNEVTPGNTLGRFYGEATASIYEGDKLLCSESLADGKEQIYLFHLDTGEKENLFTQKEDAFEDNGFLIMEETSKYLVGRHNNADQYYIVLKSDYEKSDRKNAKIEWF